MGEMETNPALMPLYVRPSYSLVYGAPVTITASPLWAVASSSAAPRQAVMLILMAAWAKAREAYRVALGVLKERVEWDT